MRSNGFVTFIIVFGMLILLVILAVGAYYLGTLKNKPQSQNNLIVKPTPITDPTGNWKIYSDPINRFSVKYPQNWREEKLEYLKDTVFLTPNELKFAGFQEQRVAIGVEPRNNLSSREYLNQVVIPSQKGSACEGNIKIVPNIPDSLKGLDVTVADGLCGILEEGPGMYIAKGDIIVSLGSGFNEINSNNRNLVNQIYSTLRFYDQNETIPLSTESKCITDYRAITDLINNFEDLQMKKDALGVLALFTAPSAKNDIDTYNFFTGKDTDSLAHLYGNVTTNINEPSYKITNNPQDTPMGCKIIVDEQRSVYLNAGENVGFSAPETFSASFEVIQQGEKWKIDKYYPTGQASNKYSAWGY